MFFSYILSNRWLKNKYIFPSAVPVYFSCSAVSLLEIYLDQVRGQIHTSQRAAQTLGKDKGRAFNSHHLHVFMSVELQAEVLEAGGLLQGVGYLEMCKSVASPFESHTYIEQSNCFQSLTRH